MLFTTIGIFILATSFALPLTGIIIIGVFITIILLIFFYYKSIKGKTGFFTTIINFLKLHKLKVIKKNYFKIMAFENEIKNFFRKNPKEAIISLSISMILWVLTLVEFKILLLLFNYNIPLWTIFLVMLTVGIAVIIPVPAALGILEISQASLFQIAYKKSGLGLVISFLTRIKDIIWTSIGLVYLYHRGIKLINKRTTKL